MTGNHLNIDLPPKSSWCHPIFFFKFPVKIGKIVKATGERDLKRGLCTLFEEFCCFRQTDIPWQKGSRRAINSKRSDLILSS